MCYENEPVYYCFNEQYLYALKIGFLREIPVVVLHNYVISMDAKYYSG